MELLDTSHGPVAYDERGAGETIVLLPSGGHNHHDYDELRAVLPDRYRTITLDWPGHGESPSGARTAMEFADVAEELVGQLAPEGAIVAGNSIGGFAAARLALRRPELVRGLVLIDTGGFVGLGLQVRLFCGLMSRPGFLRAIYPAFSWLYMRQRTEADRRARAGAIATTRADPGLSTIASVWGSFATPEYDLRDAARDIPVPTLLLWGRRDPVIPLRNGRWLERTIPISELRVFDAGHVPFTTEPETVAEAISRFADRSSSISQAPNVLSGSAVPSPRGRAGASLPRP